MNPLGFDDIKAIFSYKNKGQFFRFLFTNKIEGIEKKPMFTDFPSKENPFGPHYDQYLMPHVEEFERTRIKSLQEVRKRSAIAIPVCIIAILSFLFFATSVNSESVDNAFGITAAIVVLLLWWSSTPVATYKSSVKATIFPNVFSFFGEKYTYKESSPLSALELQKSEIVPEFDEETTEDYVKGTYSDVGIELMEAKLYTITRNTSSSSRSYKTRSIIFHGIYVLIDMNKKFSGQTIVRKDSGMIGNFFQKKSTSLQKVKLEDPIFESKFEVYSSDQVEARYLLTTTFMERLIQLSELFGLSKIECSFYDDKLLISIPSKIDMFETSSIFEPATFEEDIRTILTEMKLIFQIIDILKLNQKIGL